MPTARVSNRYITRAVITVFEPVAVHRFTRISGSPYMPTAETCSPFNVVRRKPLPSADLRRSLGVVRPQ